MSIAHRRRHRLASRLVSTPIEHPGSKPASKLLPPSDRIISSYRFNSYELEANFQGSESVRYLSSKNSLETVLIAIDDKCFKGPASRSEENFR